MTIKLRRAPGAATKEITKDACKPLPATPPAKASFLERLVMFAERWTVVLVIGTTLMVLAGLAEKYWTDFFPWDFIGGGIWVKYCDYRKQITLEATSAATDSQKKRRTARRLVS